MPRQLLLLTKTEERDFTAKTDSTFETEQRLKWKKKKLKMPYPFTFSPRKATFDEKKIFIISTAVRRIHLSIHKTTWWCKNKQNYKKTAGPRFRHTFTISENWVERNWKLSVEAYNCIKPMCNGVSLAGGKIDPDSCSFLLRHITVIAVILQFRLYTDIFRSIALSTLRTTGPGGNQVSGLQRYSSHPESKGIQLNLNYPESFLWSQFFMNIP